MLLEYFSWLHLRKAPSRPGCDLIPALIDYWGLNSRVKWPAIPLVWFHLFCFCLYQVVVHSKKCPKTWPCISLQTTWKNQNTVEMFASDSSRFRIPLSPELSIGAMTNGMSHSFQKSVPLLIPEKNKTFLPNDFQIFFLSEGYYTRISIILKVKLAANGSFVVVLILWKQRCHQKRLFMEQSSI